MQTNLESLLISLRQNTEYSTGCTDRIDSDISKTAIKEGCKRHIFYCTHPLKTNIYAIWVDCPDNENPKEIIKLDYNLDIPKDFDFNTASGQTILEISPSIKKMIIDVCGGYLGAIRRTISKEYPAEDLNSYTREDICQVVGEIKLRGSAAAKTDTNGGADKPNPRGRPPIPEDHIFEAIKLYGDGKSDRENATALNEKFKPSKPYTKKTIEYLRKYKKPKCWKRNN